MHNNKIKRSSNRTFGIVFFVVFLLIGIWPLINDSSVRIWSIIIALIFLFLGLLNSKLLTPLNIIWFKLGMLLGLVVTPIVMGIIFFFVVTPTGLIARIFRKDLLRNKFEKDNKSYWIKRQKNNGTMKQQF